jgi:hypothetical protein
MTWEEVLNDPMLQSLPYETRQTFPHADSVYECTVFNIKGSRLQAEAESDRSSGVKPS